MPNYVVVAVQLNKPEFLIVEIFIMVVTYLQTELTGHCVGK